MSPKEWEKLFSLMKRNSISTVQMAFRSTGMQKIFHNRITQQGIVEEDLLWSGVGGFLSSGKLKLLFVSGQQKAADYNIHKKKKKKIYIYI